MREQARNLIRRIHWDLVAPVMPTVGSVNMRTGALRVLVGSVSPLSSTQMSSRHSQEDVDRRRLAFPFGLHEQPDLRVVAHTLDDGDRVVSAAAGDDNDLADLNVMQVLLQQGIQQRPDIGFLVVRRHADATAQLGLVMIQAMHPVLACPLAGDAEVQPISLDYTSYALDFQPERIQAGSRWATVGRRRGWLCDAEQITLVPRLPGTHGARLACPKAPTGDTPGAEPLAYLHDFLGRHISSRSR